ncbi:hypothetical protein CYMTET_35900, partial [Cymbomonas tetramitiformis]
LSRHNQHKLSSSGTAERPGTPQNCELGAGISAGAGKQPRMQADIEVHVQIKEQRESDSEKLARLSKELAERRAEASAANALLEAAKALHVIMRGKLEGAKLTLLFDSLQVKTRQKELSSSRDVTAKLHTTLRGGISK